jgi:4-hydroxy-tetrahydrodipicolinate synthase
MNCMAAVAGDAKKKKAMQLQMKLSPLYVDPFVEANLIPVKWAMARIFSGPMTCGLPMIPASEASNEAIVGCGELRASKLTNRTGFLRPTR